MKCKKGTHVGVILSFVIFVLFLLFLLFVIEPIVKVMNEEEIMMDNIKNGVINYLSSDMTTVTVKTEFHMPNARSFEINNINLGITALYPDGFDAIVKDADNNGVGSGILGNFLVSQYDHYKDFYKVYYSVEQFNDYSSAFLGSPRVDRWIEQITTDKYIFKTNMNEFANDYNSNYDTLKNQIGIPSENDFKFSFTLDGSEISGDKFNGQIISKQIYVEEYGIEYVDADANLKSGTIKLTVW